MDSRNSNAPSKIGLRVWCSCFCPALSIFYICVNWVHDTFPSRVFGRWNLKAPKTSSQMFGCWFWFNSHSTSSKLIPTPHLSNSDQRLRISHFPCGVPSPPHRSSFLPCSASDLHDSNQAAVGSELVTKYYRGLKD